MRWTYGLILAICVFVSARADPQAVADANAGLDALDRGEYGSAVAMFTRALNEGGLSSQDQELAYVKRARAFVALRQYDFASKDLDQASILQPTDPEITAVRSALVDARVSYPNVANDIAAKLTSNAIQRFTLKYVDLGAGTEQADTLKVTVSNVQTSLDGCDFEFHSVIESGGQSSSRDVSLHASDVLAAKVMTVSSYFSSIQIVGRKLSRYQSTPDLSVVVLTVANSRSLVLYFASETDAAAVRQGFLDDAVVCRSVR
ncbi:MAG: hypothetical protein JST16_04985 [Bdellovibrionales bacterium]|nr:hypothetical protein [Bdellovibrionales bacterium]